MGFTLAEVLITLAVIGVVVAITMPSLIQHFQEKELTTSYLKIYSILNQAYTFAQQENSTFNDWSKTDEDTYNKLRPYLNVIDDCPVGKGIRKCFYQGTYYAYNDTEIQDFIVSARNTQPAVRLVSGETILFFRHTHQVDFIVDLNGDKRPNKLGYDLHFFSFNESKMNLQILPGPTWSDPDNHYRYCQKYNTNWFPGSSCGYWILKHHNMNYIHMSDDEIKNNW